MTVRPCLTCGTPTASSWCNEHHANSRGRDHGRSSTDRGYDSRWRRLSERARSLQPWCTDCGTTHDLTTDHLRWPARTLADVQVLCRACNTRKGATRSPGGPPPPRGPGDQRPQAPGPLHTPGGYQ